MYTLTGVTRIYRKGSQTVTALAGVDAVIADREWLAIQGPTGHGKTTLLQLLGGLDRPSSGTILLDGKDLGRDERGRGRPGAGHLDRVHLSDLQPDPHSARRRERRARPGPARARARQSVTAASPARWKWSG